MKRAPNPWRLGAWEVGVRAAPGNLVRTALPYLPVLALLGVVLLAPPPRANRRSVSDRGPEPGGRAAELLERATRLRQDGRTSEALALYRAVDGDSEAREDHRRRALYAAARLRLARGEESALVDLEALVARGLRPHELGGVVLTLARRAREGRDTTRFDEHAQRVVERSIEALRRCAETLDESGERARRWLERIDVDA